MNMNLQGTVKNARIISTSLGKHHGTLFTFSINLDYGHGAGGSQSAGYLELGGLATKDAVKQVKENFATEGWSGAIPMLAAILDVVGVDTWEDLPDKHVRVRTTPEKVFAIGNIIEDKWLDFTQFALRYG